MLVHLARGPADGCSTSSSRCPGSGRAAHAPPRWRRSTSTFEGGETSQVFRIGAASAPCPGPSPGSRRRTARTRRCRGSASSSRRSSSPATGVELTRAAGVPPRDPRPDPPPHRRGPRDLRRGGKRLGRRRPARPRRPRGHARAARRARGGASSTSGELGRAHRAYCARAGRRADLPDLREYRVIRRRPIRAAFRGHEFVSNPPPSSGGVLIGYGLRLLDRLGTGGPPGSAGAIARLVEVMREQERARGGRIRLATLYRGGLARRLYADGAVDRGRPRLASRRSRAAELAPPGGTTHISVVDAEGNAASLSASLGSGSGVIVPGTGIHLNNMLGEYDLNPSSGARGARPAADEHDGAVDRPAATAAAARRRQRRLGAAARRDPADRRQRRRPRPAGRGGDRPAARPRRRSRTSTARAGTTGASSTGSRARATTSSAGAGGTSTSAAPPAVEVRDDGALAAAGDPRRGGDGVVVDVSRASRPAGDAGRRGRARRARRAVGARAGGLADLRPTAGAGRRGAAVSPRAASAPPRGGVRRRGPRRASSPGCRSRGTTHPASRHVADLGLMVAATATAAAGSAGAARAGGRLGARVRRPKLELHVFPHNEPAIALYERFGFARGGLPPRPLPPRRRVRRRDADGLRRRVGRGLSPELRRPHDLPVAGGPLADVLLELQALRPRPRTGRRAVTSRSRSERSSRSSCFSVGPELDPRGELEREDRRLAVGLLDVVRLGQLDEPPEAPRARGRSSSVGAGLRLVLDRLDVAGPGRAAVRLLEDAGTARGPRRAR